MSIEILSINYKNLDFENYFKQLTQLLKQSSNELFDDFFDINEQNAAQKTLELINNTSPAFWLIINEQKKELCGIAYLYDLIGNKQKTHSACFSIAFFPKYRGLLAWHSYNLILQHAFEELKITKLYAEVFEHNKNAINLLEKLNFQNEGASALKTIKNGRPVSVITFSLVNPSFKF